MKWLTSDYSDFYIEEEQIYNPCGEFIKSNFYIKYAKYNIFGKKRYKRFIESIHTYNGHSISREASWNTKEKALIFWKRFDSSKKSITHKVSCNE